MLPGVLTRSRSISGDFRYRGVEKRKPPEWGGFWVLLQMHDPRPPGNTNGGKIARRGWILPYPICKTGVGVRQEPDSLLFPARATPGRERCSVMAGVWLAFTCRRRASPYAYIGVFAVAIIFLVMVGERAPSIILYWSERPEDVDGAPSHTKTRKVCLRTP